MEPVAERPARSSPVPGLAAPGRRARERARRRWGLDAALAIRPTIRAAAAVVLVALGAGAIVLGRGGGGDTRGAAAVAVGRGVPKAPGTEGRVAVVDSPAAIRERPAGGHALGATFADLSDEELDAVLAALDESAAALVALEPAPVPPVLPEGT
jgi:hypothetical protein